MVAHKPSVECIAAGAPACAGVPKSGRKWKIQEVERSTAKTRKGVLQHMSTSFEEKQAEREKRERVKQLQIEMEEAKRAEIEEKKRLRLEREKRRAANMLKTTTFQTLKADTMKRMSKKQMRQVKKTIVNKQGQVELVDVYSGKNGRK